MSSITIDKGNFTKRLKLLYNSWKTSDVWNGAEAIVVPVGASSEELRYHKSIALQVWLYGYELPDTIMLFTKEAVYVLTSTKKAALLHELVGPAQKEADIKLIFFERAKGDDGSAHIQKMIEILKGANGSVGTLPKDKPAGNLTDKWSTALSESELPTTDVAAALADLLSVKDENEMKNVKKAAFMTASVMKSATVPRLEGIIDAEKKVKHSKLSEEIEQVLSEPAKIQVKLNPQNLDIAYAPIVQSGGQYDLKVSAASDERRLEYDVILCSLGARYSMYCANIGRTFLVDPVKQQEEEYKALLQAQDAAINALKEGEPMSAAVTATVKALQDAGQGHLVEHLPKNIGFGMGLEFRESINLLKAGNERKVAAGMVFNVAVGASGLEVQVNGKTRAYALMVADTVLVKESGNAPEVLTSIASKAWSDVAYFLKDEEEEAEPQKPVKAERPSSRDFGNAQKKTNLRSEDDTFKVQEEQRRKQKENQEDLLKRVNEETLRQLRHNQDEGNQAGSSGGRQVSEVVAYRSVSDMPSIRDLAIQVDQKKEAVLVPIYGVMVPFHILTVKNATNNQDGDHAFIRLNFNFGPGFEPGSRFPQAVFLKELSFRTSDTRHAARVVQEIKVLRSSVGQREKEQAERATLVQQERLIKSKGRMYTLPDVWIRPTFGGKGRKVTGQLEAHSNGFRYSSPKGETLDIMYRNIKHAFYQPAENEMICLVHFHLINPIMVHKKKTQDVQCFAEVMDSVQTLDAGRRSMYDPDEIEEEQRERDQRNKINKVFQQFVKRVQQDVWERDFGDLNLEFEIPFRELGFHGVPHKSTAFVMPTVNCLVELVESPATVVAMPSVAIVNLERVGFNLRNFDMVIVFKDLTKDVFRIDAIPSQSLDTVREWLSSMDIKFYENKVNLNWKQVLKSIVDDPEQFEADGGWNFLDMEGDSDEEEEESEEGDPEFQGDSDEEGASSEEYSDSENESVVDSDEAEEEGSDDELEDEEEEGKDWDELEKEAMRDDRDRHVSDEEEEDRRSKQKRKGAGGGGRDQKRSRR
ncbi:hypothetical protein ABBQ38_008037 [Trebouxia sp. C0009 RCD-2024]